MSSQTSLVASQVRLRQWTEQIQACQQRPKGMSVDAWCEENGLTRTGYYYRMRKVREAVLAIAGTETIQTFTELPVPAPAQPEPHAIHNAQVAGVLYGPGGIRLELWNTASAEFIQNILGAVPHAQ